MNEDTIKMDSCISGLSLIAICVEIDCMDGMDSMGMSLCGLSADCMDSTSTLA